MPSKHQTVALLETAAILTNGSSLPEEKSFWPAAVSPPTSGLLGSDMMNAETVRSARFGSFSSSIKSSLPTIPSKYTSANGSTDSNEQSDNDIEEEMDDFQPVESREEDMFAMEEEMEETLADEEGHAQFQDLLKIARPSIPAMSGPSNHSISAPSGLLTFTLNLFSSEFRSLGILSTQIYSSHHH